MEDQHAEMKGDDPKTSTTEKHTQCSSCGNDASRACTACRVHVYCNAACQAADWKVHKRICAFEKILRDMMEDVCINKMPNDNVLYAQTEALWMSAPEWGCLVKANRAFMEGKLHCTPYHMGPIFPETKADLADFLFLHDYGIITTDSQAWMQEEVKQGSFWIQERQRPYVCLSFPTQHPKFSEDNAFRFVQALYKFAEKNSAVPVIIWNTYQHPQSAKFVRTKAQLLEWKTNIHDVQGWDFCPITQWRRGVTLEDLEMAEWEVETHLGLDPDDPGLIDAFCDGPDYRSSKRYPGSKSADPVAVSITTQSWDADWQDLMFVVEQAMKEADLRPVFRTRKMDSPDRLGY
ncbi:hypothetical protein P171DRAFT_468584 [Karstenula rhodostoma CBS 690.94]|uniref:MYND-type domain-containing protein n=1 Tax=Karstenula rhodostoma CBS 690.94 TaxID=1392251 RepID=A0A9P4PRV8_9PLEO|nr:hypothetical protein P171DRAFT_468584 [Karstenula rhodostoma CBS 690.94]